MARQLDNIEEQEVRDIADDISGMLSREGVVFEGAADDAYDLIYNYLYHRKENE